MRSGSDDLLMLYAESNKLKLTASDEMLATFSRLEALTKATVDKSHEFMSNFLDIIINKNNDLAIKLQSELTQQGYALMPLEVYFKDGRAKVEIGLAKGKKLYDKRQDIAKKDLRRETERQFKIKNL